MTTRKIESALFVLAEFSQRFAILIVGLAILLSGVCTNYVISNISINTDTEDMLSPDLAWRQEYAAFKNLFPYFSDTILVVVDAPTADAAYGYANDLVASIRTHGDVFGEVLHPQSMPFFKRNQLLYLDIEELESLSTELSAAQPFLAQLLIKPSLVGIAELIEAATRAKSEGRSFDTARLFEAINMGITNSLEGEETGISWQALMSGSGSAPGTRVLFTVQPRLDFSELLPAKKAIETLRDIAATNGMNTGQGATMRLTGSAALSYDELMSVIRGAGQAGILALVLVTLFLWAGLRSFDLLVAVLVTLLCGLTYSAAAAVILVGTLNMISVAFAVLYIGLGVDFALHLALRYRELKAIDDRAITQSAVSVGPSLLLCGVTTAIGFFAFIPTEYRGVAELGLISGASMMIGVLTSLLLLPALLSVLPAPRETNRAAPLETNTGRGSPILAIAIITALIAGAIATQTSFDHNPIHLNDQNSESVTTFQQLSADRDADLYTLWIAADDEQHATALTEQLAKLEKVGGLTTAASLIPEDQDRKLALIEDLSWALGDELILNNGADPDLATTVDAVSAARRELEKFQGNVGFGETESRLLSTLVSLEQGLTSGENPEALLKRTNSVLLKHFPAQIERLNEALLANNFSITELPAALYKRWISPRGTYRIEVVPTDNLDANLALERFVTDVRSVAGNKAIGGPVINIEARNAVVGAFQQAFATALTLIALIVWLSFRNLSLTLIALTPLMIASLLTAATTVLIDLPFNFANIIALPLLLGVGLDSGLHMAHRFRVEPTVDLLRTSTTRAVLFGALTTIASFGNLAISPHAGTASMGVMLSIGLVLVVASTLYFLPRLLIQFAPLTGAPRG
ncbi:MAG: MMPL family transporter [Pseudomonadota bacterium]